MIVDAIVRGNELQEAIERLGGTVTWPAEASRNKATRLEVEVDNEEAFEALPSRWFENENVEQDFAEPWVVGDFVSACTRGDRPLAEALVGRVFFTDRNQLAVIGALRQHVS
jgi:hypothetical protein